MQGFLLRTAIGSLGLWVAAGLISSVHFASTATLLWAAVLLGVANAFVRPLVILFTLPLTVLTLGLFLWVVNAAMLGMVAALVDGFSLGGFFPALWASAIVGVTGWIASLYIGPRGRMEVIVLERGHPRDR